MSDDVQRTLLASRYTPPTITFNAVERTSLLRMLETDESYRAIVIAAPAGSGKSILLAQYADRHPQDCCWYSTGPASTNSVRFWSYIVHAVNRVIPSIPAAPLLQAFARRDYRQAVTPLLNALGSIDKRITLIIDGTQNIASASLWDELGFFCNNLPQTTRIILSGRCIPRLPLTRMVLEGHTTRIGFSDMAFDIQEATRLYALVGFSPSNAESTRIFENTQGWPAVAMAMAQMGKALQPRKNRALDIADNPIVTDFLHEEVFGAIPASTLRFLELTSILPYFSETDCREFLSGIDPKLAAETGMHIETLYRDFTLLERVIGRGYRCNSVVADYLKKDLAIHDKAAYRSICAAMAAMLEGQGKPNEAIPLALEGEDWPRAIRLILERYSQLGMTAGFMDLCEWLDRIPDEYFGIYPELNIAKAMALIPTGHVEESENLLNRAEALLQEQEVSGSRPANDFMVHCEIPIIRAYNNAFTALQGDDLLRYSEQAQQMLGDNRNQAIEGSVMLMNGVGCLLQGNYRQAEECLAAEMRTIGSGESLFTPLLSAYYLAMLEYQRGNLHRAEELLDMALGQMSKDDGMRGFLGIFHVLFAWVLYDQNRLEEGLEHGLVGLAESREWEAQTSLADAYEVLICTYQAMGRNDEADALVKQRREDTKRKYPLFAHLSMANKRGMAFLTPKGTLPESAKGLRRFWFQRQVIHDCIVKQDWNALIPALKAVSDEARAEGLLAYVLETQAISCLVFEQLGRKGDAEAALREALDIAEAQGHVRIFLDEGEPMRAMLQQARKKGVHPSFAARVLRLFPESKADTKAQLSQRELDVLAKLAKGLTPKQIAEELYVSVGTVRTHLHHIYGKLGVTGQTEAILEAQRQKLV